MRILFLTHRASDLYLGGLAEFLHYLPIALKKYGIHSMIYTQHADKVADQLSGPTHLENGIPYYQGPFLKPRLFPPTKKLVPLKTLCKKEHIDLVHAQGLYRAGYMAMMLQQQTGIPYVVTSHSDIAETNSTRIKRRNIQKRCQRIIEHAAYITHLSPNMASIANKIKSLVHKSEIIHNGIDISAWNSYQNQPEQNYLLAIGRLEIEKGFPILIDAYATLRKRGIPIALVIAGSGSIEGDLKAQAAAHQLPVITQRAGEAIPSDGVVFTGYVKGEQKKALFACAKLVLFATQPHLFEEAFGIVQLEAMAAGKAIVASDMAMTRYLQSLGQQAQLVEADNIDAWVEAIQGLLEDQSRRQWMGNQNREAVKPFDWDAIAQSYARVYQHYK